MTVRELLKEIIDEAESLDQQVILFSECEVEGGKFPSAINHEVLEFATNGDCFQLFMRK